ncbi:MAG: hypothetical protein JXX14_08060, partial [Deltaproteobacteria bacterium]|nr:hypothetical protein [Deltaproteobacteria bacterium]
MQKASNCRRSNCNIVHGNIRRYQTRWIEISKYWIVVGFIMCASPLAHANLPLGGKTASMGGAGTAAGKDSAMPLINPAGFSQVPHHTLSLSASLYRFEQITVDDFFYHGYLDPQ